MIRNIFPASRGRRAGLAAGVLGLFGLAAGLVVLAGPGAADGGQAPPAFRGGLGPFKPNAAPQAAPEITFTDASGRQLSLADFRGQVVLLNFWATWCVPCVQEMPSLDRLQAKLGSRRFTVLALSVDRQGLEVVKPFLAKTQVQSLPVYLDPPGGSMRAFGVRGLPTTVVIDRDGRDMGRIEGMAPWDTPEAEALVRHYVGPAEPPTTRADATR
jgi:thiol-disulfide isomerase/thioredoxin